MTALLALTLLLLWLMGLVLLARSLIHHRLAAERLVYELRFPRNTDAKAVTTLLAGLSGLRHPWFWQWLVFPSVTFEVVGTVDGIAHLLVVPRRLAPIVMAHLRAALPGVRVVLQDEPHNITPSLAAELTLSTAARPLRTDRLEDASRAVLASLQPLRDGEAAVVQWTLTPGPLPKPPRLAARTDRSAIDVAVLDAYALSPHTQAMRDQLAKQREPQLWAAGRLGVVGATPTRARHLLARTLASFHLLNAPGVQLRRRWLVPSAWARRRVAQRTVPLVIWRSLFNAAELTGALACPLGDVQLPGLTLGGCRPLAPPAVLPSEGCVIGVSTFPGLQRPLAVHPQDRTMHSLLSGPTRSGKSTLMLSLIAQDMQAGRGVVVIDPKGDLVRDCLDVVPPERLRDVVLLDPTDDERPVGLNLLNGAEHSPELVVDQAVHLFSRLFSQYWGPRSDDILRAALTTLVRVPGMTLVELPLLLTDPSFRQRLTADLDDPVGLEPFWAWYEGLSSAAKAEVVAPLMNKLRATLLRRRVRNVIGQASGGLDMERVLAERKLLFVSLTKGLLGDAASALVGAIVVAKLWNAVQRRAGLPMHERPLTFAYIDEFQDYLHLPTSLGDMLAQAGGMQLGVTLAHQFLGQLPTDMRHGVLANCRSKIIFQPSADDARAFARELQPFLKSEDLQGLGRFEVVAQLATGNRVLPPVTGATLPPPEPTHRAASARAWSRQHYGRDRAEVEAEIHARHRRSPSPAPIGRQRRSS